MSPLLRSGAAFLALAVSALPARGAAPREVSREAARLPVAAALQAI